MAWSGCLLFAGLLGVLPPPSCSPVWLMQVTQANFMSHWLAYEKIWKSYKLLSEYTVLWLFSFLAWLTTMLRAKHGFVGSKKSRSQIHMPMIWTKPSQLSPFSRRVFDSAKSLPHERVFRGRSCC